MRQIIRNYERNRKLRAKPIFVVKASELTLKRGKAAFKSNESDKRFPFNNVQTRLYLTIVVVVVVVVHCDYT